MFSLPLSTKISISFYVVNLLSMVIKPKPKKPLMHERKLLMSLLWRLQTLPRFTFGKFINNMYD